jgi:preprotein translocase subunit YajC
MDWYGLTLAMAPAPKDGSGGSPVGMFGMMVIMIMIFYFILIRPQQRREKERREMLSKVKKGDRILFSGGIIGNVVSTKEQTVMVKIADNVKVEVSRAAVNAILDKGQSIEEAEKQA